MRSAEDARPAAKGLTNHALLFPDDLAQVLEDLIELGDTLLYLLYLALALLDELLLEFDFAVCELRSGLLPRGECPRQPRPECMASDTVHLQLHKLLAGSARSRPIAEFARSISSASGGWGKAPKHTGPVLLLDRLAPALLPQKVAGALRLCAKPTGTFRALVGNRQPPSAAPAVVEPATPRQMTTCTGTGISTGASFDRESIQVDAHPVGRQFPLAQTLDIRRRALEHLPRRILQIVTVYPSERVSDRNLPRVRMRASTCRRLRKVGLSRPVPRSSTSFVMAAVLAEIFCTCTETRRARVLNSTSSPAESG